MQRVIDTAMAMPRMSVMIPIAIVVAVDIELVCLLWIASKRV